MPQPLGPMSATIPPPGIARSMPSRTGRVGPVRVGNANDRSSRRIAPRRGAVARSSRRPVERAEDRRGRRVEPDDTPRTAGRRSAASSGRGSIRSVDPGHRRDRRREVRRARRSPTARRGSPSRAPRSRARPGRATGKPVTSALTSFQNALRAGPPQTRISVTRTPAASIGAGDVADGQRRRLDDRPRDVAAAVRRGSGRRARRAPPDPRSASARRRGTAGRRGRRRRAGWRPPRRAARRS